MYDIRYGRITNKTAKGRERIRKVAKFELGKSYYHQTQMTDYYHTCNPKLMADMGIKHLGSTI